VRAWAIAGLVLGLGVEAAWGVARPGRGADDLCSRFGEPEVSGTVTEPRLIELSGLAASRDHAGVLWAHNDSGGAAELYAMAEDGTALGSYPIAGVTPDDWEDVAVGPRPVGSGSALFIGDIGDNSAARSSVEVHLVSEPLGTPVAPGEPLSDVETVELRYPDGAADAEALLVDPRTGDLVVVTKSLAGASQVLTAPAAALRPGQPVTMRAAGQLRVPLPPDPGPGFPGTIVTAGDVTPDGSIALLRTYRSVLAFERGEDETLAEALLGEPCFAPQAEEAQGEAIAFTADGSAYVTASEGAGARIHRIEVAAPSTPSSTTTLPSTTAPRAGAGSPEAADDRSAAAATLVVAGVVLLVLGAGAVVWSRRGRRRSAG
jgi:hypothetical protein